MTVGIKKIMCDIVGYLCCSKHSVSNVERQYNHEDSVAENQPHDFYSVHDRVDINFIWLSSVRRRSSIYKVSNKW